MKRVVFARIPAGEAGEKIRFLLDGGYADIHARISKDAEYRYVPVLPEYAGSEELAGFEFTEGEAHTLDRRSPQERIREKLSDCPEILDIIPRKWEFAGDIAILRLDPGCVPYGDLIGRVYAEVLGVKTVCADVSGVSGEFRQPDMRVLYGTDTESVRLENGIYYRFDVTEVIFASGNTAERMRMRNLDCRGETVVDMFAGIGYFTLPLAKFSGAGRVFACEKNPDSYKFLIRNIRDNRVSDTVIPMLGDCRNIPGRAFADRILMGYVQKTSGFVPYALRMLKPGGIIHYHDTFYTGEYETRITEIFDGCCGRDGYEILSLREVKSFAPSVSHYVADIRAGSSPRNCSR
ncbi:MAG: class I SAM-dependent methyltransferase family protein [Candidatus Methanomethylophilaceae archaeon]|nr:class I SAM-dependent methyltransferase family protein [Candidatus Methanomethylophilaceae archaeon]